MRALLDLDDREPGEEFNDLLFHYTTAEQMALILDSGEFWLTPYRFTNDPREKLEWLPNVFRDRTALIPEEGFEEERRETDRLLRTGARLGCHTIDRVPSPDGEGLFHRGWARARMWEQYADSHQGVCLVFDKEGLNRAVDEGARHGSGDLMTWGPVRYLDKPMRFDLWLDEVRREGLETAIGDAQAKNPWLNELYFTKNLDWASESEYRQVVVLWDLPSGEEDIPVKAQFGSSLKAVVVGEHFQGTDLSVLRHRAHFVPATVVARCVWEMGAPRLIGPEM